MRKSFVWRKAVVAAVFFAVIVLLQLRNGAYCGEFGGYPDEAGHYVSGLMVHDYLAQAPRSSIQKYAINYYLHYPKVAIGHWPPVFYVLQALWTLIFSTSRISLILLMASVCAIAAFALYRAVASEIGEAAGIAAGLFLIVLPAIQESTSMVMSDIVVGMMGLLATLRFGRFMESGKARDAFLFGLFAALTILTKGTGLALAGVPIVALALTNRWKLLLRPAFWLPVAVVAPLCVPWYWLTRHMLPSTGEPPKSALSFIETAVKFYVMHSFLILGAGLFALALIGFVVQVVWRRRSEVKPTWAVLAALLLSIGFLVCVVPALSISGQQHVMAVEERFLVPAVPAMVAFSIAGLELLAQKVLARKMSVSIARAALILILAVALAPKAFSRTALVSFGFEPVAKDLLSQSSLKKMVMLISSDASGEGMFVSEIAMHENRPGHYVVRASKVLCDCSWSLDEHNSLYPSPAAMMSYLNKTPIEIVVYDESAPARSTFDFYHVLGKTIQQYPTQWKLLRTYPITREGVVYPLGIKVYKLTGTNPSASLEVSMRRMLGITVQLNPQ